MRTTHKSTYHMSENLMNKAKQFGTNRLLISIMVCMLCVAFSPHVKANNEPYDTITLEGTIPLNWSNDSDYPWTLEDGYLKSGNFGHKYSASKISFSYSSQHTTNISFKYQNYDYSTDHHVEVFVDGQRAYESNYYQGENSIAFRLPKGNHTITVRDSVLDTTEDYFFTKLWDVKVTESPAATNEEINNSSCV